MTLVLFEQGSFGHRVTNDHKAMRELKFIGLDSNGHNIPLKDQFTRRIFQLFRVGDEMELYRKGKAMEVSDGESKEVEVLEATPRSRHATLYETEFRMGDLQKLTPHLKRPPCH